MENLNAEQVKRGLECCVTTSEGDCIACGYRGKKDGLFITCTNCLMADALSLIIHQETEYNELYELCESYRIENERLFARNLDLAEKGEKVVIAYKELSKENERLMRDKTALECIVSTARNQAKADTVRKMQERLKEHLEKPEFPWDSFTVAEEVIDQIAKELVEGADNDG